MTGEIDFWFSIGSTYTYLTVMRIGELARKECIGVRWRPFSVRALMIEQNNIPFRDKPIKAAYMWRDIERRARARGYPAKLPVPYPLTQWDCVNRLAVFAATEGWCEQLAVETYRRWFQCDEEPGIEPQLSETLRTIGQNPERALAAADSVEMTIAYNRATDEARALSLFGSPSFIVDGEIFWGDDRLEDAISWAKKGHV